MCCRSTARAKACSRRSSRPGRAKRAWRAGGADPQSLLPSLCGGSRGRGRGAHLPAEPGDDRLPARPRRHSMRRCSRAPSRSISARPRTRKARWPITRYSRRRSRSPAATISCCSPMSAIRRSMATTPPPGALETAFARKRELCQCRRFPIAVEALRPAGPEVGLRRGRSRLHRGFRPLPQRRLPASAAPRAACLGRGLVGRGACGGGTGALPRRISTSPTSCSKAALATGARRAPSFCGSIWPLRGRRGGGENPLESLWCQSAAGHLSRARASRTAEIRARTMSGSPSCMTLVTTREALARIVATLG